MLLKALSSSRCYGVRKEATQGLAQENHLAVGARLETATLVRRGQWPCQGHRVEGDRIQEALPRRISELPTAEIGASSAWVEDRQAWVLLRFYHALVPGSFT